MSFKMIQYVVIFLSIISVLVTETDGDQTAELKENDENSTELQTETNTESYGDQKNTYELVVQFLPLENGTLVIPDVEIIFKYLWENDDVSNKNNNKTETETEKEKPEEEEKEQTQNQPNAIYNPVPYQPETAEKQQNLTSPDNSTTPTLSPEEFINNPEVREFLQYLIEKEINHFIREEINYNPEVLDFLHHFFVDEIRNIEMEEIVNNPENLQILKSLIADEIKNIKMEDDLQKEPITRPTRKTTISPKLEEQPISKLPMIIPPKYAEQPITRTTTMSPQPGKPPVTRKTTFSLKLRKQPEASTTSISPNSRKPQGMSNSPTKEASTYTDPFDPNCYYSTEINPDELPQEKGPFICMHCCPFYDQYYIDYMYYINSEAPELVYCRMVSDAACT